MLFLYLNHQRSLNSRNSQRIVFINIAKSSKNNSLNFRNMRFEIKQNNITKYVIQEHDFENFNSKCSV